MRVSLEKLEEFLTDDRDELDTPGWESSASAEAFACLYIAARQGFIDARDLILVASRCDRFTPFLIQRVLTREHMQAAQEIINLICEKKYSTAEYECVFMLKAWIARKQLTSQT